MVAISALALVALLPAFTIAAPHGGRNLPVARDEFRPAGRAVAAELDTRRRYRKRTCKAKTKAQVPAAAPSPAQAAPSPESAPADPSPAAASAAPTPAEAAPSPSAAAADAGADQAPSPADPSPAAETSSDSNAFNNLAAAPAAKPTPTPSSGGSSGGSSSGGLLNIGDSQCGPSDASPENPNGSEGWLNCGIDAGGWNPPHVTLADLKYKTLTADGPFAPCAPYISKFEQYGNQYGIPPILLASIALQESTCNPTVTGGNGESGLMQLIAAHCGDAPGGDCYNVDFNIGKGAEYFSQVLAQNNGNALAALGNYNGWRVGMTVADATRAKSQGNCFAQNNLDYLYQTVNGWMQGKEGYSIGQYFNLKNC
ncbi:putative tape measure protein [Vanrija pseudolonga]|uniref:Tape measure protein n=1 Tax=Vanrija pseudolonga TaxID=143232 RepID=A0AAF1BNT5_9TREE|nr:putative tape measure protein [Vanrija pseudolonga]